MITTLPAPAPAGHLTATAERLQRVNWAAVAQRTRAGISLCWAVAQLLGMVAVLLSDLVWEHRQEIRQAAVAALAATIAAAEFTYRAGRATRRWLDQLADASATMTAVIPAQLAPIAPVLGPLAALSTQVQPAATIARQLLDQGLYPQAAQVAQSAQEA